MKKLLIMAGIIGLMSTTAAFASDVTPTPNRPQGPCPIEKCGKPNFDGNCQRLKKHPDFKKFEETLKLTDEQKAKAKEIRENEKEQIKPIFEKIGEKYREQKEIMDQKLTAEERQKALAPIRKEIHELRGEIHKIKKQSKESFEAILTSKQVKQLNKMKADAKKNFKKRFDNGRPCARRPHHPMPPVCRCNMPPMEPPVELPVEPPIAPVEE